MDRRSLNLLAAGLAVLLVAGLAWVMLAPEPGSQPGTEALGPPKIQHAGNPQLELRFSYDARYMKVGPFIDNAEFPMLLEGDGWILQGKRISGMATLLHKEPISALYDWLGVMQMEGLERYYDLKEAEEPVYEDWNIGDKLAVHQRLVYETSKADPLLPAYISDSIRTIDEKGARIYIEGWVFFTDKDLFFFQAVSSEPLDEGQRQACDLVLQSLEFDALAGRQQEPPAAPEDGVLDDPQSESEGN